MGTESFLKLEFKSTILKNKKNEFIGCINSMSYGWHYVHDLAN